MKTFLVVSSLLSLIIVASSCLTTSQNGGQIDRPQGLVISGDSAYFPESLRELSSPDIELSQRPAEIAAVDKGPELIRKVQPNMPDEAKSLAISGRTRVRIWVDRQGRPQLATIESSSNRMFNEPSLLAAMNFRFKPATMRNGPISVWISVPFTFTN